MHIKKNSSGLHIVLKVSVFWDTTWYIHT